MIFGFSNKPGNSIGQFETVLRGKTSDGDTASFYMTCENSSMTIPSMDPILVGLHRTTGKIRKRAEDQKNYSFIKSSGFTPQNVGLNLRLSVGVSLMAGRLGKGPKLTTFNNARENVVSFNNNYVTFVTGLKLVVADYTDVDAWYNALEQLPKIDKLSSLAETCGLEPSDALDFLKRYSGLRRVFQVPGDKVDVFMVHLPSGNSQYAARLLACLVHMLLHDTYSRNWILIGDMNTPPDRFIQGAIDRYKIAKKSNELESETGLTVDMIDVGMDLEDEETDPVLMDEPVGTSPIVTKLHSDRLVTRMSGIWSTETIRCDLRWSGKVVSVIAPQAATQQSGGTLDWLVTNLSGEKVLVAYPTMRSGIFGTGDHTPLVVKVDTTGLEAQSILLRGNLVDKVEAAEGGISVNLKGDARSSNAMKALNGGLDNQAPTTTKKKQIEVLNKVATKNMTGNKSSKKAEPTQLEDGREKLDLSDPRLSVPGLKKRSDAPMFPSTKSGAKKK